MKAIYPFYRPNSPERRALEANATGGDNVAQFVCGALLEGEGDLRAAAKWYRLASEQGHQAAHAGLANALVHLEPSDERSESELRSEASRAIKKAMSVGDIREVADLIKLFETRGWRAED